MKKSILVIVFILSFSVLYASSLVLFDLDHPVYDDIEALYLIEGKASPLLAKPWSVTDVRHLLQWAGPISTEASIVADRIRGYIKDEEGFSWKFNAALSPRLFTHSNPADFGSYDDAYDVDILNTPFAEISFTGAYDQYVAGYINLSVGTVLSDALKYDGSEYRGLFDHAISTNIPFVPESSISMNFPNRAYIALGFDALRFVVGRDRVEWGTGVLGNMMLGDTLPYHDYISLTFTGSKYFSYQMLVSFFTHSVNLSSSVGDRDPLSGLRFFLGHRFEFTLFSGKLIFALNESIIYQSKTGYLDPRVFNPLLLLHDFYIAGNANSLAALEVEYSPVKNLSLYLQFAIDDLAMPNEPKPGEPDASVDGWGIMLGARYIRMLGHGYIFGNAEAVYTSPFLYHRAPEEEGSERDLYYISTTRYMVGNSVRTITRYLSFPFGSDAIAAIVRVGYDDMDFYRVSVPLYFMAHGVIDAWSKTGYGNDFNPVSPSTENPFDSLERGEVEYTFAFGAEGEIRPLSYLSIDAGAYAFFVWNKDNSSHPCSFDIQFSLGLSLYY